MNRSFAIIVYAITLFVQVSCNTSDMSICTVKEMKTLFTTQGIYEGKITGYAHYVLIDDFARKCMDSVTMVNLALEYSDTVQVDKPADIIMFFNSDKDFIPNETSQVMEEINKSCLVIIGINMDSKKPEDFIFYNKKGERLYWGERWLPNGK